MACAEHALRLRVLRKSSRPPPTSTRSEHIILASERPILSGMAGRYATALFDLALEANAVVAVKADLDRFDALVCAGEYRNSKPHPEAFLLAAEKLGVPPNACLVFEDTDMGIEAATAAGMKSARVPPPWTRNPASHR